MALMLVIMAACSPGSDSGADTIVTHARQNVAGDEYVVLTVNTAKAEISVADSIIPDINDPEVCLCVEAAFTGEKTDTFRSSNVAGDYVACGVLHHGYDCEANTGMLCSIDGKVAIAPLDSCAEMSARAVASGGSLFQQMLLIHNGKDVYRGHPIGRTDRHIYRSACITRDGGFAIIQSRYPVQLDKFISALLQMGARNALYLDMGMGWNYGWYREQPGDQPNLLFSVQSVYQTNWLVVKPRRPDRKQTMPQPRQ